MIFALTLRFATYVVLDFIGTDPPAKLVRFNLDKKFLGCIYFMILIVCVGSSPCVSCRGPSSSSCTECPSNMALAVDGTCVTCGSGFYYSDATSPCGSCLLVVVFE